MKVLKTIATTVLLLLLGIFSQAQHEREVAILDLSIVNSESNPSRIESCRHILNVSGFPYFVTTSVDSAILAPVVLISPKIETSTFSQPERDSLTAFTNRGGVVIASSLRDPGLFSLFGVTNEQSGNTRFRMYWDTSSTVDVFEYIDDSLEVEVSLGRITEPNTFYTRTYDLAGGISFATYEDAGNAWIYNQYGMGHTYVTGIDLRDVIFRNYVDSDFLAHRTYSNGFEPTMDTYIFVIANIIRKHLPHSVRLHTSPWNSTSTVMITHDVDAASAFDTMGIYADLEQSRGVVASYYITTKYFSDWLAGPFYIGVGNEVNDLINKGHVIGSHSVGHFPDFGDASVFSFGQLGNTTSSYTPSYNGTVTSGGSVLGELEVSRDLLESDYPVTVETFRAGYLEYPDSLPLGLDTLGYKYNTNFSANNVLTNFPFFAINDKTFSGRKTSILEIPMTISDAAISNPIDQNNYPGHVNTWTQVTRKNDANHAPTVLLVHPNRVFKRDAQRDYMDSLVGLGHLFYPLESYGDYWKTRLSFNYSTTLSNDTLYVHLPSAAPDDRLSFIIDDPQLLDDIVFLDPSGAVVVFDNQPWDGNTRLYWQDIGVGVDDVKAQEDKLLVYPNPTRGNVHIVWNIPVDGPAKLRVYDVNGRLADEQMLFRTSGGINSIVTLDLEPGIYVYNLSSGSDRASGRLVVVGE